MPLSSNEQQKIQDFMKGKNNSCSICRANSWGICDDLIVAPFFDLEYKRIIEGKVLPMIALICNECGNVRQIAAAKVGLMK